MKSQIHMEALKRQFQLMNNCFRIIYVIIIFLISSLNASDNKLHLVHADKTIGRMYNGERVHIWTGNVEAYQDTVFMFCDSTRFYEFKKTADFIGNVLIDDGHHKLWADRIEYLTDDKIAICYGRVRISGKNDSLYSEVFVYDFKLKSAKANQNVFLWDKTDGSRIWGDSAIYVSSLKESHIWGNSRLKKPSKNKTDTLTITSKKMDYFGDNPKHAIAVDSVFIMQNNLIANCDSAIYDLSSEKVFLRINPIAWQNQSEMSGLKIDLGLDSLDLKEISISGNAEIKTLADSIRNQFNILQGKSIQVFVDSDQPSKVIARQNARSQYLIEQNTEKKGTNAASSDSIIVFFKEGVMDSIIIAGGTEGTFYPPDYKGEFKSEH